jgi:CheY-like chemotaxis protein
VKRAPPTAANQPPDVLLIEPDAPTAAHLAGMLRRAGYVVDHAKDIDTAVARACALQPRCVVCDDEALGVLGTTIAQTTRTNSPRACLAPFIFLVPRSQARTPGARSRDSWLEKPFSTDAFLEAVGRFAGAPVKKADSSMLPPVGEAAMDGDLSLISLRTLVSMLELEKRSGVLVVTSRDREATITFRDGRVTRTRVLGRSMKAADAVAAILSWAGGRFVFKPMVEVAADKWAADLGH